MPSDLGWLSVDGDLLDVPHAKEEPDDQEEVQNHGTPKGEVVGPDHAGVRQQGVYQGNTLATPFAAISFSFRTTGGVLSKSLAAGAA
eukprot:CAMPEP_0170634610 /NCGR_PEP_ID=MMETSP0224-20130122/36711_1 /TAXON_ID=285029 /ORGANISM="Togula jolla, Strain CCCM 725" /LENGTH=86 /DNA_ID=CAMNT_0010963917 /DNA_START=99 /DNA_END=360 /DNA_ORIENTATION=-